MIEAISTLLIAMIALAVLLVLGAFAIVFIEKHFNTPKKEVTND
jgi:hypothetical protein